MDIGQPENDCNAPDQNKKENKIQQQSTSTDEKRKQTTNTQQTINQRAAYIVVRCRSYSFPGPILSGPKRPYVPTGLYGTR